jgi:hypothetical protein
VTADWLLLLLAVAAVAIWAHDFFEGESLLPDLWDEWRIGRATLDALDALCARNPARSTLVVSLTTIPSRLAAIDDTLKSLLRQTRAPAEIRLNVPAFSEREGAVYDVPARLQNLRCVRIVRCEDLGPATKLIPTLRALEPATQVLAVDDDRIYPACLIETLDDAARLLPDAALGLSGWIAPADLVDRPTTIVSNLLERPPAPIRARRLRRPRPVDVLQGLSGYLVRPDFFDLDALGDYARAPEAARFVDDVWVSAQCRAPKYVIPAPRASFVPYRRRALYARTALGRMNRGGGDPERRNNTIMLKFFASAWQVGGFRP